jgi:hypothetical protein
MFAKQNTVFNYISTSYTNFLYFLSCTELKMNDQIKKPNTYTSEFRESSIKLALESDQPIAQTARDLGVNPNTIHT